MADARLVWRELSQAQPNVAPLLGQANDAFNNAADAASGILGRYEAGVKGKNDAEVRQELAAIKDEAGLDKWLANGGLNGRQVSDDVLGLVSGGRNTIIGYTNDRSIIRDRDGRLVIAQNDGRIRQDVNARAQGDWNWQDGQRRELAGLSGAIVGARTEGQDYGQSAPTQGVQAQVYQGLLARGMPEHIAQGFMMNFQDESGFNIGVEEATPNVHGTRGKGLYQLTGDRRERFEAKYGNNYSIDNQLDFLMEELGGFESRAWETIRNSQNAAEAGANIVNNFLRPADEHARSRTAKYVGANGYSVPVTVGTPRRDALEAALANSQYLSPDQIHTLLNTNDGFVQQGVDRQTQERLQRNEDLLAQLTMDAINNPANTTPAQVQQEVASRAEATGLLSSSEVLAGIKGAEGEIAGSPGLAAQLAPTVEQDVRTTNIIEGTNQDTAAGLNSTVMGRMVRDIPAYQEDPTAALEKSVGGADYLRSTSAGFLGGVATSGGGSGYDRNDLTDLIRKYADQFKVTEAVAAAAMNEAFVRDPTNIGPFNANTLGNRFREEDVGAIIKEYTDLEGQSKFGDDNRQRREFDQQLQRLNTDLNKLQVRAAKTSDPQERQRIQDEIVKIYTEMTTIRSKAQTLYRGSAASN